MPPLFQRSRLRLFLFGLLAVGLILAAAGWLVLGDLPVPSDQTLRPLRPSTYILDRHGQLLYEVIQDDGKHTPVPFDAIPAACWQATVAVEDSRFFQHPGFDPVAIARAAYQNWRQGTIVSGASTLTQQLARNTMLSQEERYEQSLLRKGREAWLAWRIERRYSKEEILALYLNQVYYGNFAYGLEAAAQAFFSKSARELDLAECSLLAGLPQSPGLYNPLNNLEAARWRQATVLGLMVFNGYIERSDAELALAEGLQLAATPFPIEAPHFVSYVEGQLERLLGQETVSRGGLRVKTTLDLGSQRQAEAIVARRLQQLADEPGAPPERRIENGALVALDPQTGAILVMVGSPDYFDPRIDGAVNGALALRQPGSAIKPVTYAAAMDPQRASAAGHAPLTAATVIADVRTAFLTAEEKPYAPQNYDLTWHGPVSARTALASSYNLPAVKVLEQIGVDALVDQAQRQGINTFRAGQRYGLALTLGGGEVSLLELTGAYAAFANGGYRVEAHGIDRVEDLRGNVLFQGTGETRQIAPRQISHTTPARAIPQGESTRTRSVGSPQRALDPRVAYLITDILSDDNARAPSFGQRSVLSLDRPAAVKTGTTTDWRDNWTIGYTPNLVSGVWVGNADNTPMVGVSGISGAGPIWQDFMLLAHRQWPPRPFSQPDGLIRVEVCADSGLLPTAWCTRRRSELFIAGTQPTEFDTVYRALMINACSQGVARATTPSHCLSEQVFRVYPPELREWALANGIPQLPPIITDDQLTIDNRPLTIDNLILTSPDPNRVYRLSTALPPGMQQIRLAARPGGWAQPEQVTFLVDGQVAGLATQPPFETWWQLEAGSHAVSAIALDQDGREAVAEVVWIEVR